MPNQSDSVPEQKNSHRGVGAARKTRANESALSDCPTGPGQFESAISHLKDCISRHHEAAAHIAEHLRESVRRSAARCFIKQRELRSALKEIERALELSKVAEAKFEALFSRWGY